MSADNRIYERAMQRGPVETVSVFDREWWMTLGEVEFKHRLLSMAVEELQAVDREIRAAMTIIENKLGLERDESVWRRKAAACVTHLRMKRGYLEREILRRKSTVVPHGRTERDVLTPQQVNAEREMRDAQRKAEREDRHAKRTAERRAALEHLKETADTDPGAAVKGLIDWLLRPGDDT